MCLWHEGVAAALVTGLDVQAKTPFTRMWQCKSIFYIFYDCIERCRYAVSYDGFGRGTDDCHPCPRGFYYQSSTTCIPCQDGYTTNSTGAFSRDECQHYSALCPDSNMDCGANGECKLLTKSRFMCVCDPGESSIIKTFYRCTYVIQLLALVNKYS